MEKDKKLIKQLFDKGILINKELLGLELNKTLFNNIQHEEDILVLNEDYLDVLIKQTNLVDWYDIDSYRVNYEKNKNNDLYQIQLQNFKESNLVLKLPSEKLSEQKTTSIESEINENKNKGSFTVKQDSPINEELNFHTKSVLNSSPYISTLKTVEIITSFHNSPHKYEVIDFTRVFLSRYQFIEGILRNRKELEGVLSINRILSKKEKENAVLIGLVENIGETKKGNLMLTLEDPTGLIKVFFSRDKKELFEQAKDLVYDEVVGISGVSGDKIIFAEKIIWPDIPSSKQLKKGEDDEYIIFLSDIHVGSNLFMEEEFNKFLRWINGEVGNEKQREIAQKIKYIIIAGDLVDGVGIYPSQIEELKIKDVILQYQKFSELIKKIPSNKQIIICPGNHDAIHLAEPQTSFDKNFSPELFEIPNVTLVTNPALINIGKTKTFSGFNILIYHGYSFDYYVANVESIRNQGGYSRADLIMKFLLKRRHLAPSFKSTPYFPAHREDPLLIKIVPDFFISGHIHYSNASNYKGVTMISGSCWQNKTSFQEKLGHEPEPTRVPIVNLKTREIKILKFTP